MNFDKQSHVTTNTVKIHNFPWSQKVVVFFYNQAATRSDLFSVPIVLPLTVYLLYKMFYIMESHSM